mgnify:CR=1 FL=1
MIEANLVGEIAHTLRALPGVFGFVGAKKGGEPVPMRQSEINRILGKVDELAISDEYVNIPFVVGETVKVIDGPFNDFNGVVENVNYEKSKVSVAVQILGRPTPVELNFNQVEKS